MTSQLLNDRDIDFLLYEFLDSSALPQRPRYTEHNKEVFDATLNTAKGIAEKYFADHNQKGDTNEPAFDGEKVHLIPETKAAWDAFAEAGFLCAHQDFEEGGMQLPEVVLRTAMGYFSAANIATTGYPFLTIGAANLIRTFASDELKAKYLPAMMDGRFAGTMALTEPGQGSALGDLTTKATPQEDGSYRISGSKMFISGGDQSITENIVHMVLAKIEGAPAGVKGISLFLCPKFLVNDDGSVGERNDVALAGLIHKMGYRNTTSTCLNFGEGKWGEKGGAIGYLIGEPHKGLQYMFQMMNEARIGVGTGAAVLAYQGYVHSLDYARQRPQGRLPSNKDPLSKQVMLVDHADVRRLLLSQKAYAEGSLALCLLASQLFDDSHSLEDEQKREQAFLLLDVLTPIVKSWPSKYGLKGNEQAIQVLGGSGYTREYIVEQLYRDQRLNPIHEGAEAIHGLDLLGRKVTMKQQAAYRLFLSKVEDCIANAKQFPALCTQAETLEAALATLKDTTDELLKQMQNDVDRGLANATLYLDVFGHITLGWIWLQQACIAQRALDENNSTSDEDKHFYRGKLQAAQYFSQWELPQIEPWAKLLKTGDDTCFEMQDAWF